jgi:Family of unknown function (DUF6252)
MKQVFWLLLLCILFTGTGCSKNDAAPEVAPPLPADVQIGFLQDTVPVKLRLAETRKEIIGALSAINIQGKYPDSTGRKNTLTLRVLGDSAGKYGYTQIIAGYTDSLGNNFTTGSDTANTITITKLEKKYNGLVTGTFSIVVYNAAKTKKYNIKQGSFTTLFID